MNAHVAIPGRAPCLTFLHLKDAREFTAGTPLIISYQPPPEDNPELERKRIGELLRKKHLPAARLHVDLML